MPQSVEKRRLAEWLKATCANLREDLAGMPVIPADEGMWWEEVELSILLENQGRWAKVWMRKERKGPRGAMRRRQKLLKDCFSPTRAAYGAKQRRNR